MNMTDVNLTNTGTPTTNKHPLAAVVARVRAFGLDRDLAKGVEPSRTAAHAARARQLTSERTRMNIAKELDHLHDRVKPEPRVMYSAAVKPSRASVRATQPQLVKLSERLRTADAVEPRGVAALRDLLTDGAGPLYHDGNVEILKQQLVDIDTWLVHSDN
jgi:hypothetical protein